MGSSALVGSSIRSTSGFTASARAMQRRCCWPPERPRATFLQPVFHLVPNGCAAQGLFHNGVQLFFAVHAVQARAVGHVVIYAHGKGVRLLKYHADLACAAASRPASLSKISRPRYSTSPSTRTPGTRSFMRFSVFMKVDFPQPDGPMRAVIGVFVHL